MSGWSETAARDFEATRREQDGLHRWRKDQIARWGARVGLTVDEADTLADEAGFDIETFRRMIDRGATLDEALAVAL